MPRAPGSGTFSKRWPLCSIETRPVPRQEASIRRLADTQDDVVRKTLSRPVALKPLAIEPEQSVFRSGPQKARPILKKDFHRQVGETFLGSVIAKTVLLGLYRRSKGEADQGGRETQYRLGVRNHHIR